MQKQLKILRSQKKLSTFLLGILPILIRRGFYFIVGRKNRLIKIHGIRYNLDDIEKELNFSGFPQLLEKKMKN